MSSRDGKSPTQVEYTGASIAPASSSGQRLRHHDVLGTNSATPFGGVRQRHHRRDTAAQPGYAVATVFW